MKYICEKTNGQIPVIASGGIFTGEDAKEKIDAGASLVQVWTGFIYEGPAIVKNICKTIKYYNNQSAQLQIMQLQSLNTWNIYLHQKVSSVLSFL